MYPEWVEKYHIKGTAIKIINENYYLYKVTSKRIKGKDYPVSIQKYIGKITRDGVIEPNKISFTPGIDKIIDLGNILKCDQADKRTLNKIYVIEIDGVYYSGKLSNKEILVIKKYFNYDGGKIWTK